MTTYNFGDSKFCKLPSKKILSEKAVRGLLPQLRKEDLFHSISDHESIDSPKHKHLKRKSPDFASNIQQNQLKPVFRKRRNYLLRELRGFR